MRADKRARPRRNVTVSPVEVRASRTLRGARAVQMVRSSAHPREPSCIVHYPVVRHPERTKGCCRQRLSAAVDVSACRRVGVSTCRRADVSRCRRGADLAAASRPPVGRRPQRPLRSSPSTPAAVAALRAPPSTPAAVFVTAPDAIPALGPLSAQPPLPRGRHPSRHPNRHPSRPAASRLRVRSLVAAGVVAAAAPTFLCAVSLLDNLEEVAQPFLGHLEGIDDLHTLDLRHRLLELLGEVFRLPRLEREGSEEDGIQCTARVGGRLIRGWAISVQPGWEDD